MNELRRMLLSFLPIYVWLYAYMVELYREGAFRGSEAPAWAQAIGSVVAIVASALVTVWATDRQAALGRLADKQRRQEDDRKVALALCAITQRASDLLADFHGMMNTRDAVETAVHEGLKFERNELLRFEQALDAIPLHDLHPNLVSYALEAGWTVRQFRLRVEQVFEEFRQMSGRQFEELFEALPTLSISLIGTAGSLRAQLSNSD